MSKLGRLGVLVVGIALVATAAGCGKASSTTDANAKVTLSYAVWDKNQVPAMQQLASRFTQDHPKITINVQLTPWADYWTKLKAAVTGGAAPDVFWMNGPSFQLYASNGVIRPVDAEIAADKVDLSAYPPSLVDLYTFNGKHYGLPKDFDTVGLWYNKELFDAKGVKYPGASWTWADFNAAAAKLTDKAKGQYAIAANLSSAQEYMYDTIYQAGGYVISPDGKKSGYADPATIAGLRFWTDLIKNGQSPDLKTMTDTAPINLFESGKTAMYWGGSWDAAEFSTNDYTKTKVDVAPLPKGQKQATIIHGLANVVSAKTTHPAQAWQFVKFLGSQQSAEILGQHGVIPAYNGTQNAWVTAHAEFHLQAFLDQLAYAVPYPVSKNTAAWQELETKYLTPAWRRNELLAMSLTETMGTARQARAVRATRAPQHRPRFSRARGAEALWGYALIAPTGLGLAVFYLWPVVQTAYLSFTHAGPFGGGNTWTGLANYRELLADSEVRQALLNTLEYTGLGLAGIPIAVVFAALLCRPGMQGVSVYRTLFFLPVVTTPVAVAMIWRWLYNGDFG